MTSVWFKWRSATRRKQKSWYSLSPSLPSLSPSLSPRSPPAGTTSIQLKYVTITEWQLDTQWPVRTFISQCFILVRSQTAEKNKQVVSRLGRRSNISGMPTYQTFDLQWTCQSPIRQCVLKNLQRLLNCPPAHHHFPHGEHPFVPRSHKYRQEHGLVHPRRRAGSV